MSWDISICVLYKIFKLSLFFSSCAGRAGGWWEGRGSSWSSRWHSKSHLTYLSLSSHCMSANNIAEIICIFLKYFLIYQGPPGDRGERGESGDPGYKVSNNTLDNLTHIKLFRLKRLILCYFVSGSSWFWWRERQTWSSWATCECQNRLVISVHRSVIWSA